MNKKLVLAITALILTMNIGFTCVHADPVLDKSKTSKVQTQQNSIENKVEMIDNQIETIMSTISKNEINIATTQNNIKQNQIDIAKAAVNIKAEQLIYNKRMRVLYMNGSSSYLEVILGSTDIDDFVLRLEDIQAIMKFDQNVINDLKLKEREITLKKVALDEQNTKLLSLRANNNKKLTTLTKQKSDQAVLIAQINTQINQYSAQSATSKTAVVAQSSTSKTTVVAQFAMANVSTNVTTSRGGSIFSSNSVIAYATTFLGIPYVWGGTSPSGFDCSGFTQYIYAHFGLNLPRVSGDQQNIGQFVPRASLQPGDLVFFGSPVHHVGIYVGNGNMINAPHTGAVIRIQPLNSDFTNGRRLN